MKRFGFAISNFFRHMGPAFAEAKHIAEIAAPQIIAHPEWGARERRNCIVSAVKEEVGLNHPQFAWLVAMALDLALNYARKAGA